MKIKKILLWLLAIVITVLAAIYQRTTGPSYERKEQVTLRDSTWEVDLIRSSGARDARIKLPMKDPAVSATLYYKRFKNTEGWSKVAFKMEDITYHGWFMTKVLGYTNESVLVAYLPMQPPAGKLEYFIELSAHGASVEIARDQPVVIRFKGDVPAGVLIPHIILMFLAMLFATTAGLFAIFKFDSYKKLTTWTFIILLIGGFLFGPWVQLYAFGDWWTGIPFGWDLTDNKT
ncbi:MAG: hypothetical protein J7L96_10965, partial [Bacteroidales bacterium]|nr:hypothetical protein [Bacteroidales bacterium]